MIKVSNDDDFVKVMRDALMENNGYCPCAVEKTEDTKCMCKDFRELEEGACNCGLYIKEKDY